MLKKKKKIKSKTFAEASKGLEIILRTLTSLLSLQKNYLDTF